ncbi:MAG TPA: M48 family metalloprotease [Burkholderiaceae bacterium]|nr:M48 family metalloprotease [Burkholderiaceae bacterium]
MPLAKRITRCLVYALCALLIVEPALMAQELPTLGEAGAEELSPLEERHYGEEIMQQYIRRSPEYLDDPETTDYINRLGYQLVAASAAQHINFEFFVLRDPTINAFALPGGFIGVHTGLILTAQSESELASVLGHEIGHVQQRHLARSLARERDTAMIALASVLVALLAARSNQGSEAALAVGQGAALARKLSFSRNDEREADRVGFQILVDAGFDPQAMADFFARMQQGTRAYASVAPAYLQTHPMTEERIADMQARIRTAHTHQHADSLDFQLVRARLHVLQDESTQGLRDSASSFADQIARLASVSDTAAYYGLALADLKLKRPGPGLEAALAARRSTNTPSAILDNIVLLARYEAAQNDAERDAALRLSQEAAARFPLSRPVAMQYTDLLQRSNRHAQAITYLREQLALSHNDPDFYNFLATSYAALNHKTLQHQATAEMYLLLGSAPAAVEQLQIARKVADADFYTMTEVDARLRQLTALVREEREAAKTAGHNGP